MSAVTKPPVRVMAHLVAGFPTDTLSLAAADGLAAGGVSYFEIQLPFSDPSADGVAIQTACAAVLERGYRVSQGLAFVAELRRRYPEIPAYIMTYGNLAWKPGIERFAAMASEAGSSGLIVPDLPFDSDEGLSAACEKYGLVSVPVAAPSMSPARIAALAALNRPLVYAALRAGITGKETTIDADTLAFIASLDGVKTAGNGAQPTANAAAAVMNGAAQAGNGAPPAGVSAAGTGLSSDGTGLHAADGASASRVLGGFGIRNGEQAAKLAPHVHAVVAGSVFVEAIRDAAAGGEKAVFDAVKKKASELTGFGQ